MTTGTLDSKRSSSIELLKIVAIVLIVLNHTVMTIAKVDAVNYFPDGISNTIDLRLATCRLDYLVLIVMRHFGAIGNSIFLIPSVWFLSQNSSTKTEKAVNLVIDTWLLSVLILASISLWGGVKLHYTDIVKSFLPMTFKNNWYVTAYLLLYLVHGVLNSVIEIVSKKQHFTICAMLSILYMGFGTISTSFFYYTHLMYFVTVYFVVSYIRRYASEYIQDKNIAKKILMIGFIGLLILIVATDFVGLHLNLFRNKMWFWAKTSNPFTFLIALGSFGLALSKDYSNKGINYISGLSLFIYLIHENLLVRSIVRPKMWMLLTDIIQINVVCQELIFALIVFAISLGLAAVYNLCFRKICKIASRVISRNIESITDDVFEFINARTLR